MNPKKQKLTKSDLSSFFSNCLRPPGSFKNTKSPEPKPLPPFPGISLPAKLAIPAGFRSAGQDTSSRTFRSKPTVPVSPTIFKSPVVVATPIRLSARHPSLQTKRRISNACFPNQIDLFPASSGSRKSLHPVTVSIKNKRSFSKDDNISRAFFKQSSPIVLRQSPAHLLNIRLLGATGVQGVKGGRASQPNQFKGKADLSTKRGSVRATPPVTRIQTSKEFRDNFQEYQATHKPNQSKANFDNYVQRKSGFLQPRISSGLPQEQLEFNQNKVGRLDKLVEVVLALDPATQDAGTSKSFRRFYDVNFLNSNMNDLLKEIAKQEALENPSRTIPKVALSTNGSTETSLKQGLIRESLRMMREHMFFEDFLQLLTEKGVDIENLFSFCNQRLKIRGREDQASVRPPHDLTEASASEISLLDLGQLTKGGLTSRSLAMDFTKLRRYSSSGSEGGD